MKNPEECFDSDRYSASCRMAVIAIIHQVREEMKEECAVTIGRSAGINSLYYEKLIRSIKIP